MMQAVATDMIYRYLSCCCP